MVRLGELGTGTEMVGLGELGYRHTDGWVRLGELGTGIGKVELG